MHFSKFVIGLLTFLTLSSGAYLRTREQDESSSNRILKRFVKHKGYWGYWGYWTVEKGYYKHGKFYCTKNCVSDSKDNKNKKSPKNEDKDKPNKIPQEKISENEFSRKIFPWILKWEGKTYVNNPNDAGGSTKYGITYINNKAALNANGINSGPEIVRLTESQAEEIYRSKYWDPVAEKLPYPMNWIYFNAAVNNGPGNANNFYQKSGLDYEKFIELQKKFYNDIANKNPSQRIFLKGWLNRLNNLEFCINPVEYTASACK
jgi:hypothetical protein